MMKTETLLVLMSAAAISAVSCIFVNATRHDAVKRKHNKPQHYKDNGTYSFTGWLEKLDLEIDKEIRNNKISH